MRDGHNALDVCLAYHLFFSTHTHTLTAAIAPTRIKCSWCHVRNAAFFIIAKDKSSTKAHKLVHNYMHASTALRDWSVNNEKKRTKVQNNSIRMEGKGISC